MEAISTQITILLSIFWMFCCQLLYGQDTIYLKNPSFEDVPRKGTPGAPPIFMWKDCAAVEFPTESPPDIHPVYNNAWGVTMQPQNGDTYLGLVVRAAHSWESVGQKLNVPLKADSCYTLSVMLNGGHIPLCYLLFEIITTSHLRHIIPNQVFNTTMAISWLTTCPRSLK